MSCLVRSPFCAGTAELSSRGGVTGLTVGAERRAMPRHEADDRAGLGHHRRGAEAVGQAALALEGPEADEPRLRADPDFAGVADDPHLLECLGRIEEREP